MPSAPRRSSRHVRRIALVLALMAGLLCSVTPAPASAAPVDPPGLGFTIVSPHNGSIIGGSSVTIAVRLHGGTGTERRSFLITDIVAWADAGGDGYPDTPYEQQLAAHLAAGRVLAMTHDESGDLYRATIDLSQLPDTGGLRLGLFARDADSATYVKQFGYQLQNAPIVTIQPYDTSTSTVTGAVAVEADALDLQTPASALAVTVTAPGGASTALRYDAARRRFVGTWPSTSVPDGITKLVYTAVDADGHESTAVRDIWVRNDPGVGLVSGQRQHTVDGILDVTFAVTTATGLIGPEWVQATWRIDDGPWQSGVPTTDGKGYVIVRDTRAWTSGAHTLHLRATDRTTERVSTNEVSLTVDHSPIWLSVGTLSPVRDTTVGGIVPIEVVTERATPVNGWVPAVTGWYSVDAGQWRPLTAGSGGRLSASWDTRSLAAGPHIINTFAIDWAGRAGHSTLTVNVSNRAPLVLRQSLPANGATVRGRVPIVASASGGAVAANPLHAVTAWYQIDRGQWQLLSGPAALLAATWNTEAVKPGRHSLRVLVTDWQGGHAMTERTVVVPPHVEVRVTGPVYGTKVGDTLSLTVEATSDMRATNGISVWAYVGWWPYGEFVPFTLGLDSRFHATLDLSNVRSGEYVVGIIATDYASTAQTTSTFFIERHGDDDSD